jgi:tetratricopeptide (TPR) repeat protein
MLQTARELAAKTSDHPDATVVQKLQARAVLANAYDANDRLDLAAAEADRAIEQGEALMRTQPSLAGTVEWLRTASCNWHARSDAELGIVRCEQLLEQMESGGRIESRNGQEALLALGMAQARLDRHAAALATYRRAERALIAVEGADTRSVAMGRIQRNIGASSFRLARYDEAEAARRRSLEFGSAFMGTDHPSMLEVRMELADTLLALERRADAREVLREDIGLARLSAEQRARWDELRVRTAESAP